MEIVFSILLIFLFTCVFLLFGGAVYKGVIAVLGVAAISLLSSYLSVIALAGHPTQILFSGSITTGPIPFILSPLSGWFILIINFNFLASVLYGFVYLKTDSAATSHLAMHWISYLTAHVGLLGVCVLQNSIAFLIVWELMALSTFMLIIFEHSKRKTIKAGMNFLIQSHISILFLTIAFILVAIKMKSYDFKAISQYSQSASVLDNFMLFCCFFIGFAGKTAFVPFHTWLPRAHKVALPHISGIMSVKIGIFGILQMLLLMPGHYMMLGIFILVVSIFSGLYGIILAVLQQNLKILLSYSSIENIGIIGIGIGMGSIGLGIGQPSLAVLGLAGALLHTMNYAITKPLLFFGAGNVYQESRTVNIELLGGLSRRISGTAILFLIGSLAISGLTVFNNFISEFIIYQGIFNALTKADFFLLFLLLFTIFILVLIGGLAVFCYTKAFSIIFLGHPRNGEILQPKKESRFNLLILTGIAAVVLLIGLFPKVLFLGLVEPITLFTKHLPDPNHSISILHILYNSTMQMMSAGILVFLFLIGLLYLWRSRVLRRHGECGRIAQKETWGCGYQAPKFSMQYTSNSYVRNFRKIIEPILYFKIVKNEIKTVLPAEPNQFYTNLQDKLERLLIHSPLRLFRIVFNQFVFLQNGKLQFYILYGMLFITLILTMPWVYDGLV